MNEEDIGVCAMLFAIAGLVTRGDISADEVVERACLIGELVKEARSKEDEIEEGGIAAVAHKPKRTYTRKNK